MSLNKVTRALQRSKEKESSPKPNKQDTISPCILCLPDNGRGDSDFQVDQPNSLLILTVDHGEENRIVGTYNNVITDENLTVKWAEKPIGMTRIKNPLYNDAL